MRLNHYIIFILFATIISFSCSQKESYDINNHYSEAEQDTIMTDIIVNIYKVPKGVRAENKRNPEYRHLYVKQLPEFEFVKYTINDTSNIHYFYLIRPARNTKGHVRGVLGKYKIDDHFQLYDFEEICVTPMMAKEEVISKGEYLWKDLMYFGNLDRYHLNKDFIEFPDERTRYDKKKMEWTYSPVE